jgi:hypothetical protein
MRDLLQRGDVKFLEDIASEDNVQGYVLALARKNGYIDRRFILHEHLYEAKATIGVPVLVRAYLASLGYEPEAREQPPVGFRAEHIGEVDVEVAYAIVGEAFRWDFDCGEELVTAEEAQHFMQQVRETTTWAVLAFTNLEIPVEHKDKSDLLGYPFHRVVTDVGHEAGVILVGEQDTAMIWFVNDDSLSPSRGRGGPHEQARDLARAARARKRGPPVASTANEMARCRICGFAHTVPPWGEDGKSPCFEICHCCGVKFGYEDATLVSALGYRKRWLALGGRWFRKQEQPAGWDLKAQLSNVPRAFRDPGGKGGPSTG